MNDFGFAVADEEAGEELVKGDEVTAAKTMPQMTLMITECLRPMSMRLYWRAPKFCAVKVVTARPRLIMGSMAS